MTRDIVAELEKSELNEATAADVITEINHIGDYGLIADTIAAAVAIGTTDKQKLLEISSVTDRLAYLLVFIQAAKDLLQAEHRMRVKARRQMFKIV